MAQHYLDTQTGKAIAVVKDTSDRLQELYELAGDDDLGDRERLEAIVDEMGLPDWQKASVIEAHEIEIGFGTRYLRVPTDESREAYDDMVCYTHSLPQGRLRDRLEQALEGRGPFRRLKDVLGDFRAERVREFARVVGNQHGVQAQRMSSDQGVQRTDRHPDPFQFRTNGPIGDGGLMVNYRRFLFLRRGRGLGLLLLVGLERFFATGAGNFSALGRCLKQAHHDIRS